MATWDQQLISRIILTGDIEPVLKFGITPEDFQTPEGRTIYQTLLRYHQMPPTDDSVWGPTALKEKFPTFQLVDDPSMTIEALCHEVRTNHEKLALKDLMRASAELIEADPEQAFQRVSEFVESRSKLRTVEYLQRVGEIFAPQPAGNFLCESLGFELGGPPSIVSGPGFGGKTMVAQDMALGCATGTSVFGGHRCRPGRVLHLDYEQGRRLTNTRYQGLASGRGLSQAHLGDNLVVNSLPKTFMDDVGSVEWLKRMCDGFHLVIVDSLRAACPRTDENSSEARKSLDAMHRVAGEVGCAFLVVHHANKGQAGGAAAMRGSTAIHDAADNVFLLKSGGPGQLTVVHNKARAIGTPVPSFDLEIVDSIGPSGQRGLQVIPASSGITNGLTIEQRVISAVGKLGPCSKNAIHSEVGGAKAKLLNVVDQLAQGGHLLQVDGKYRLPSNISSVPGPPLGEGRTVPPSL